MEEKALKIKKVSLTVEELWDIVSEYNALSCKTQGQTIVFKDEIYTLLANDEQHTQMKPSKVPTSPKKKQQKLFSMESSYLYIYRCISKNLNIMKKLIFSCNLFQKVKLSYILGSLHVK